MLEQTNRRIVLASRPNGEPTADDFRMEREPAPSAAAGEAVVRNLWLSVDPYMRMRIDAEKSYATPVAIDEVMIGLTVGQVVASNSHLVAVGDAVLVPGGWQDYCLLSPAELRFAHRLDRGLPLSTALGVAGMPGATAYLGLQRLGKPQSGATLVVSAAAGAVGSVVTQLGKLWGCRVVGIAGSNAKCRLSEDVFGADVCLNYKEEPDLAAALAQACPDGIDIYFENVGGAVLEAVLPLLNANARVPVCGYISQYNAAAADVQTPMDRLATLDIPLETRTFLVTEWTAELPHIYTKLAELVKTNQLQYRESVTRGLEQAPKALQEVLRGHNIGKQVVRIGG